MAPRGLAIGWTWGPSREARADRAEVQQQQQQGQFGQFADVVMRCQDIRQTIRDGMGLRTCLPFADMHQDVALAPGPLPSVHLQHAVRRSRRCPAAREPTVTLNAAAAAGSSLSTTVSFCLHRLIDGCNDVDAGGVDDSWRPDGMIPEGEEASETASMAMIDEDTKEEKRPRTVAEGGGMTCKACDDAVRLD
ncbi:hypothetical protein G7046_g8042 [Stylonectria norvegica]|nr:hypothetical protein G7046_g8042 [Stylonectria norvegica]